LVWFRTSWQKEEKEQVPKQQQKAQGHRKERNRNPKKGGTLVAIKTETYRTMDTFELAAIIKLTFLTNVKEQVVICRFWSLSLDGVLNLLDNPFVFN
jgi:hypothetical protein